MSDWRLRAETLGDVVYFRYVAAAEQRETTDVYVWDLDKTYLDTHWGTVRELTKTIVEKAFQKRMWALPS